MHDLNVTLHLEKLTFYLISSGFLVAISFLWIKIKIKMKMDCDNQCDADVI